MPAKLSIASAVEQAPNSPGFYRIYLHSGLLLKVGIGSNLKRRLRSHAASRDSGLKIRPDANLQNLVPSDITSKSSILAKHLYFDGALTKSYDLKTELGRRRFLFEQCYLFVQATDSVEMARAIESKYEDPNVVRYVGLVKVR